uniref:1-aminocyclopropane-1-carboxylate synthase-like protein (Inactive) like n=1 Tax=Rousettus aegyptiacus TaxID=9407 RepID=A0A7J8GUH8_ROUAE|nr:1-aminocyclopropane-1-carboxylate synthase-like protein (inactive) like [Rousettus aegyptiacus]
MSSRLDTDYKSCGQISSRGLRNQSTHTQLLKMMLCLQKTIEDYVVQLKTQHPQQGLAAGGAKAQGQARGLTLDSFHFQGIVNLGVSENKLCTDLMIERDFGISGFHFGALYTQNKKVISAISTLGVFHSVSGIAQYKLRQLLHDREWIDKVFLPTNRSRLQAAHKYITNELKALKIPFLSRGSGLYIWMNLKKYLDPCTYEQEELLHRRFLDNKLMLGSGKAFMCKEPGWFRLVFADKPFLLKIAMHRFSQVLEQKQEQTEKQLKDALRD